MDRRRKGRLTMGPVAHPEKEMHSLRSDIPSPGSNQEGLSPVVITAPLGGWLTAISELPDPVFADRIVGEGIAIDPTGDVLFAPCDAQVSAVAATGHAVTLKLENGAEILLHLGIETVALHGVGFEPCVTPGAHVHRGDPLLRFDLDLVVRRATSAMTPVVLIHDDGFCLERCRKDGLVEPGEAIFRIVPVAKVAVGTTANPADVEAIWRERTVVVPLAHGLHARPAASLREAVKTFEAQVRIVATGGDAGLNSPAGLLALGIRCGEMITVRAAGKDADVALATVIDLIESGMGEAGPPVRRLSQPSGRPRLEQPAAQAMALPVDGRLAGVMAVPGLAVGVACHIQAQDIEVEETGAGPGVEAGRLDDALASLRHRIEAELEGASGAANAIFAAHLAMLDDEDLRTSAERHIRDGASAGMAWRSAIRPLAERLTQSSDPRMAERSADMLDLERRVLLQLAGRDEAPAIGMPGGILLADDLLPSHLIGLGPGALAGICLARGGPTSHVSILAAGLGIPMLVAAGPAIMQVAEGTELVLDAAAGMLETSPDASRISQIREAIARAEERRAAARAMTGECCTADGHRVEVFANLGSLDDVGPALANGAEGCGLLRSEFLFLDRTTAPGVEEQAAEYQAIADALAPRPLIIRLLDIGGDKPAPYLPIAPEENPMLGLRGIRVGLAHRDLLATQIEAILRVRPIGRCKIMVPMVASLAELTETRALVEQVKAQLGIADPVELGVMVETPAAAITADLLAQGADFLSIGTNDLTQYVLAMDRGNDAVAAGIDGLHPSVLRLIDATCRGAAQHDRWTGVCGGLASDPLAVAILVGLGVTELSVAPAQVADIKAIVAGLSYAAARDLAQTALTMSSTAEVRAAAREFAQ